jgi:hypothetical protein
MSDFCDDASKTSELYLSIALNNRPSDGPVPKGFCHNCTEPLAQGLRFCDVDCRDDWTILSARKGLL